MRTVPPGVENTPLERCQAVVLSPQPLSCPCNCPLTRTRPDPLTARFVSVHVCEQRVLSCAHARVCRLCIWISRHLGWPGPRRRPTERRHCVTWRQCLCVWQWEVLARLYYARLPRPPCAGWLFACDRRGGAGCTQFVVDQLQRNSTDDKCVSVNVIRCKLAADITNKRARFDYDAASLTHLVNRKIRIMENKHILTQLQTRNRIIVWHSVLHICTETYVLNGFRNTFVK